jgi:hypothetical protein
MSDYWDKYTDAPLFAAKRPTKPLDTQKFQDSLGNAGIDTNGMQEKAGVIEPGRTPPENPEQKSAADLEDSVSTRLADSVAKSSK